MGAFETAQALIHRAATCLAGAAEPKVDLKPAATLVSRSLAEVYGAMDHRDHRLGNIRAAQGVIDEAAAVLAEPSLDDPQVEQARALLAEARQILAGPEGHFASIPAEAPPPPRQLMASQDQLSLHWVDRAPLTPKIQVPEPPILPPLELPPLDKPKNVDELQKTMELVHERAARRRQARAERALAREQEELSPQTGSAQPIEELPEGFVPPIEPALTEYELTGRRCRELFEEIAMLGSQRMP